jgi:nitrite reductase/ring-hydroxylating ferredoxin subunit
MSLIPEMPSDPQILLGGMICPVSMIESGGVAYRFQVLCGEIEQFAGINADPDDYLPAFVIQFGHEYFAYLNRCAHVAMELDWNPGEVFDEHHEWLVCATHYAVYEPKTGRCVQGPCPKGALLRPIPITVKNGIIYFGTL